MELYRKEEGEQWQPGLCGLRQEAASALSDSSHVRRLRPVALPVPLTV